ncbi:MAG: sugar MFS transporter [Pedobacter sp.]|nr:sugar MFS transporter [Pedobacter sp.]
MPLIPIHNSDNEGSPTQSQTYLPALIALGVLYFMMGFITCLNDTLVPFFKKGFTLSYSQSSLVQFYFFLTYGLMSIPAGKIVEKTGYKMGMVAGFFIAGLGAFLFYPASVYHQYPLFLAALFIVAIGIVLLQVAANPYITILGPAQTASSRLTLIQGVGSIGTTIAPVFGAAVILSRLKESSASSEAVRMPYIFIGLVLFAIAIVVARLKLPAIQHIPTANPSIEGKKKSIFAHKNLKWGIVGLFMYVGAEVSIGTFLTNYIADTLQLPENLANSYVAFYWGGMLIGRLIGSFLLKAIDPPKVLVAVGLLAMALIAVSICSSGMLAVWSMVAVGLCNSIMFAVIFSLAVSGLGSYTTKASGLLSTAIVGGAVISYVQGAIRDQYTWQIAFLIPLICYLYIVFYGWKGHQHRA